MAISLKRHRPGPLPLNIYSATAVTLLVLAGAGAALWRRRGRNLHTTQLQNLLDVADALERDLMACRTGLARAQTLMSVNVTSVNPDLPAASEHEARNAISAGLRGLLQQRLWIRDHSAHASTSEFATATAALRHNRERLQVLLQGLAQAHSALDNSIREHIHHDGGP